MERFWTFFSFPLNLLLALLWLVGWGLLWRHRSDCRPVKFLLSPIATMSALSLLIVAGLWVGFSGNCAWVQSVPFVFLLLYIQTVVYLVTLRGWKRKSGQIRWRFLLIHAGFLLAVGSAFWGAPDSTELRIKMERGQVVNVAYRLDGRVTSLGYQLFVDDYSVDFTEDGKVVKYEAIVSVNGGDAELLTVNHPLSVRLGEDVYLASVSDSGCVFQIVREPWRYFALAGILMLLVGAFMLFIKGPQR